jgi:hypothetical protein
VAVTRAERVLLLSGHRWPATGEKPRLPSEFLVEAAEAHGAQTWAEEPAADAVNPATLNQPTALWPADPLGARAPDVQHGAELVRAALRARLDARTAATDPGPSSRCSTSNRRPSPTTRTRRAGPSTSTCCWPNGPPPARVRPRSCRPSSP